MWVEKEKRGMWERDWALASSKEQAALVMNELEDLRARLKTLKHINI